MFTLEDVLRAAKPYSKTNRKNPKAYKGEERPGCVYTSADGRHCVAGQIATDLGVEVPGYGSVQNSFRVSICTAFREFDPEARSFLNYAQMEADEGVPWWKALSSARRAVEAER